MTKKNCLRMKTKNLVRNTMANIEAVILSPLYVLLAVLWLLAIPVRAVIILVAKVLMPRR